MPHTPCLLLSRDAGCMMTGRISQVASLPSAARWRPLLPILLCAFLLRAFFATDAGLVGDAQHFAHWTRTIDQHGLLNFYDAELRFAPADRPYPPLSTLIFGGVLVLFGRPPELADANQGLFVVLFKVVPIVSELALIAAAYAWLIDRRRVRNTVAVLLALAPGLVVVSGWWGQFEALYALFVVLSLMALTRGRVIWAWLLLGVALLFKQPAIVAVPVLLVLTYRRYGLQRTLQGLAACAALCAAAFAPFVLYSGLDALSPYLKMSGAHPYLTNNAHNFWYLVASIHKGSPVLFREYPSSAPLIGGITRNLAGLTMLALFGLLMVVVMWRRYGENREFLWTGALYIGFFVLPTEVHERYLYAAVPLLLLAAAQAPRLWVVAVGTLIVFSYNILGVMLPYRIDGAVVGSYLLHVVNALASVVLFALTTWIVVRPAHPSEVGTFLHNVYAGMVKLSAKNLHY